MATIGTSRYRVTNKVASGRVQGAELRACEIAEGLPTADRRPPTADSRPLSTVCRLPSAVRRSLSAVQASATRHTRPRRTGQPIDSTRPFRFAEIHRLPGSIMVVSVHSTTVAGLRATAKTAGLTCQFWQVSPSAAQNHHAASFIYAKRIPRSWRAIYRAMLRRSPNHQRRQRAVVVDEKRIDHL